MRKNFSVKCKGRLLRILCGASAILGVFSLSACDNSTTAEESSHQHTYASEWSKDENDHWYAASCDHTTEVKEKGAHAYGEDSVCDVCGYEKAVAHEHSYATTWSKDENDHWYAATCEHTTEVKDKGAHAYGEDNVCDVCGYEKAVAHEHSYATTWSKDKNNHWYAATCEHSTEVKDKGAHAYGEDSVCDVCGYNRGPVTSAQWATRLSGLSNERVSYTVEGETVEKDGNLMRVDESNYIQIDELNGSFINYVYEEGEWQILVVDETAFDNIGQTLLDNIAMMNAMFGELELVADGEETLTFADAYDLFTYVAVTDSYEATLQIVFDGEEPMSMSYSFHFAQTGELVVIVDDGEEETTLVYGGGTPLVLPNVYAGTSSAGTPQGPISDAQWATAISNLTADVYQIDGADDYSTWTVSGNIIHLIDDTYGDIYIEADQATESCVTYMQYDGVWVKNRETESYATNMSTITGFRDHAQELLDKGLYIFADGEIKSLEDARDMFRYDAQTSTYTANLFVGVGGMAGMQLFEVLQVTLSFNNGGQLTLNWTDSDGFRVGVGYLPIVLPNAITMEEYIESLRPPQA